MAYDSVAYYVIVWWFIVPHGDGALLELRPGRLPPLVLSNNTNNDSNNNSDDNNSNNNSNNHSSNNNSNNRNTTGY